MTFLVGRAYGKNRNLLGASGEKRIGLPLAESGTVGSLEEQAAGEFLVAPLLLRDPTGWFYMSSLGRGSGS